MEERQRCQPLGRAAGPPLLCHEGRGFVCTAIQRTEVDERSMKVLALDRGQPVAVSLAPPEVRQWGMALT